jgi:hypothetical protein
MFYGSKISRHNVQYYYNMLRVWNNVNNSSEIVPDNELFHAGD